MKIDIAKSLILTVGCILLMTAIDLLLSNILYAILYGVSFCCIMGTYLNINIIEKKKKINITLHIIGNIVFFINNLLVIPKISTAILFSISVSILFCGTFIILNTIFNEKNKK